MRVEGGGKKSAGESRAFAPRHARAHAPGTFELRETREALEPPLGLDLSFPWTAFRTDTVIMIPSGSGVQAWPVTGDELRALVEVDLRH